MNTTEPSPEITAAMRLWTELSTFAAESWRLSGRGAVLMERTVLLAHAPGDPVPPLNYISAEDVPAGDDFRTLMLQYEPERQVVLILGGGDSGELALVIEPSES
jgi:hypothetical protein